MTNARLISNGISPADNKVFVGGEELKGIVGITYRATAEGVNTIEVEVCSWDTDVEGDLVVKMRNPRTGNLENVSKIAFASGEEWQP